MLVIGPTLGPWELVTRGGAALTREGNVGSLNLPIAASFLGPRLGWVIGEEIRYRQHGPSEFSPRIVSTSDGGRNWRVDYTGRQAALAGDRWVRYLSMTSAATAG